MRPGGRGDRRESLGELVSVIALEHRDEPGPADHRESSAAAAVVDWLLDGAGPRLSEHVGHLRFAAVRLPEQRLGAQPPVGLLMFPARGRAALGSQPAGIAMIDD